MSDTSVPENASLPLLFFGNSYHYPDIYRSTGFRAQDAY